MAVEAEHRRGRMPTREWWLRFTVVALMTLLASTQLWTVSGGLTLTIDSSAAALGRADLDDGLDTVIVAGFGSAPIGVSAVAQLIELESKLRNIEGVSSTRSIASVQIPITIQDDIDVANLEQRLAENPSPSYTKTLIQTTLREPTLRGRLVSANHQHLSVFIELFGSAPEREAVASDIRNLLNTTAGPLEWTITGPPVITPTIGAMILDQLAFVVPLGVALFFLVILLAFQKLLIAFGVITTLGITLIWTFAIAAAMGWSINLVTLVTPPLILVLALSYSMHVICAHADEKDLIRGLQTIRLPLLLSAVTTAIGLAALGTNSLLAIRQFALLGAVGSGFAALSAVLVLPLFLQGLQGPPQLRKCFSTPLQNLGTQIVRVIEGRSTPLLKAGTLLLILSIAAATFIEPGTRYLRDLPDDAPLRVDYERISTQFGGGALLHIDLRGPSEDLMLDPEVLTTIDKLQQWLLLQPGIASVISGVDYIKRLNQTFSDGSDSAYRLPSSRELTKQLVLFAAPTEFYRHTNANFSSMRLELGLHIAETPELRSLLLQIEHRLKLLPPGLQASVSGDAYELSTVMDALTRGQWNSLLTAALAIFVVLALVFGSIKTGFLAMLPNVLPVAVYFGLLGISGTHLSPTNALVACIVLGIAVDDSLHLLVRFGTLARQTGNEKIAVQRTIRDVLPPISLTTIAACLGFLTLTTSPFHSQVMFGSLAAATLLFAWVCDLILAPAVADKASIVTLWDVLKMDLGERPQDTIPLFAGMTNRQARIFALNMTVSELEAQHRLIREGDAGRESYVLIDGSLRVWTSTEGVEREIRTLHRGAICGEIGFFAQRRSANVTTQAKTRVLCFDPERLEHLRLRHPRIAALVYRNLNREQALRQV